MTAAHEDLTHAHIMEAVTGLRTDVKDLTASVNGNGHLGLKGRVTRVETILTIVGVIAITGTSMASCALNGNLVAVPRVNASP